MAKTEHGEKSPFGHIVGRRVYQKLSRVLLPTDLKPHDGGEGLERARSLLKEGMGLVIVYTHPSRTDTYREEELWKYSEFAERRVLTPIALHQDKMMARVTAAPTGLEFHPVVTTETIERYRAKNPDKKAEELTDKAIGIQLGEFGMMRKFLEASAEVLSVGGIILFAPSTTRTDELSMAPKDIKPTDMLLNNAASNGVRFAVFITAFEINGVTSYKDANGFNPFKRYTLHTGATYLDTEISEHLADFRKDKELPQNPRRPFTNTDEWLFHTQFPLLVPPSYNPKGIGR